MRCINNCSIATGRLRRHVVSSLDVPFQRMLVQWLTIQLPEDGHICHLCFLLLTSESANHGMLGHTMVCLGCGRSVRDIRHHIIDPETPLLLQDFREPTGSVTSNTWTLSFNMSSKYCKTTSFNSRPIVTDPEKSQPQSSTSLLYCLK